MHGARYLGEIEVVQTMKFKEKTCRWNSLRVSRKHCQNMCKLIFGPTVRVFNSWLHASWWQVDTFLSLVQFCSLHSRSIKCCKKCCAYKVNINNPQNGSKFPPPCTLDTPLQFDIPTLLIKRCSLFLYPLNLRLTI